MTNEEFVHIREAYWSAGDRYGWAKDGMSRTGVGIASSLLRGEGDLLLALDKPNGVYTISKEKARELVTKYSAFDTRRGVRLAVVPLAAFEKTKSDDLQDLPEHTLCGKPHNNAEDTCAECEVIRHNV